MFSVLGYEGGEEISVVNLENTRITGPCLGQETWGLPASCWGRWVTRARRALFSLLLERHNRGIEIKTRHGTVVDKGGGGSSRFERGDNGIKFQSCQPPVYDVRA